MHETASERRSFAPMRRYRTGRALAAYVLGEIERGRQLEVILSDDWIQATVAGAPYLLEDLAEDREIAAAHREQGRRWIACGERSRPAARTRSAGARLARAA